MDAFNLLNQIETPLWVIDLKTTTILWSNNSAQRLCESCSLDDWRNNAYSSITQKELKAYLPSLKSDDLVKEVWSKTVDDEIITLGCTISLVNIGKDKNAFLIEGHFHKSNPTIKSVEDTSLSPLSFTPSSSCESPRFFRRVFSLSHATMADS